MRALVQAFWEICLFRSGPQDLPASHFLLALVLVIYAIVGGLLSLLTVPFLQAVVIGAIDIGLMVALVTALLWALQLGARSLQTLTALAGASALLEAMALPFMAWQQGLGGGSAPEAVTLPAIVLFTLMVWNVAVIGHILRHALASNIVVGVALALVYFYASVSVTRALLPVTGG